VRPERFELPTYCSGGNRSIHLSYGRIPTSLHPEGGAIQLEGLKQLNAGTILTRQAPLSITDTEPGPQGRTSGATRFGRAVSPWFDGTSFVERGSPGDEKSDACRPNPDR
jgi:hypothetical protein